ncbi:MAG: ABC transporter substrate-binding protein [Clostridia bacterium]|nr:ABC transporter substrate-binding protein [Clostridia bacterium]
MKRLIALFLTAFMLVLALAACTTETNESSVAESSAASLPESVAEQSENDIQYGVRIAGMKGPTSIGLVGLLEESDANHKNVYEFTLAGAADEITPKLIKGELDIAAVPANLASVLYNNTSGKIKLLAVNNLGVLYIVAKNATVSSVEDLRGKTILATGKGTTPEYTLRHILKENGIDPDTDVTLDFKSEATEVVAAMAQAESAVAMLPQPYVTVASNKIEGLQTVLDLNEEWAKIDPESAIVTGVIVVRDEFAKENPEAVKVFLEDYKKSIEAVNADAAAAAKLVVKHGIFENEAVIAKAIPYCNLKYIAGGDMKGTVNAYLTVLYNQNPKSVGGKLPEDDFYYTAE